MRKCHVMKKPFLLFAIFSTFFFCGCLRVNTNPQPIFEEIQQDVLTRTGHTACWDTCPGKAAFKTCIENVLEQGLRNTFHGILLCQVFLWCHNSTHSFANTLSNDVACRYFCVSFVAERTNYFLTTVFTNKLLK